MTDAQTFRFRWKARLRTAASPLVLALLLGCGALWRQLDGARLPWILWSLAAFFLIRAATWVAWARYPVELRADGLEYAGTRVPYPGAHLHLTMSALGGLRDVRVQAREDAKGRRPTVRFDTSLERFDEVVRQLLLNIPSDAVTVAGPTNRPLGPEAREKALAPYQTSLEARLKQMKRGTLTAKDGPA